MEIELENMWMAQKLSQGNNISAPRAKTYFPVMTDYSLACILKRRRSSKESHNKSDCSRQTKLQTDIALSRKNRSLARFVAEITPMTSGFVANEYDLDRPTEGFSSIPEAIEDIYQGNVCFCHS